MPILAFATSVANMVQKESVYEGTTTSSRIDTYVKEGFLSQSSVTSESESILYFDLLPDSWWFSVSIYNTASRVTSDNDVVTISDGSDNLIRVYSTYDSGNQLTVDWYDGTEYVNVGVITSSIIDLTENLFRMDIEFSYGTSGHIKVYINRQEELSYSGDTTISGITPSQAEFGSISSTNYTYYSGMFFSDEDSTLITPVQYELTSDGTFSSDFTNDYTYLSALGETGDNFSVESSEAGDASTYKFASRPGEISGGTVVGLGLFCRAKTQESVSADQFRFISTDLTDTEYSEYIEMDQYITPYQCIFDTAPSGDAWTLDDISSHEFGFEVSENG
jgi:hypothetical protein